jgi:small-conductance mechanosensitive channel
MRVKALSFVTLVLVTLLAAGTGRGQQLQPDAGSQAAGQLTPEQAQQALGVLQDDAKRAQLIQTLRTIAKASPPPSSQTGGSGNLGVQLLVQLSNWFGELSGQLAAAARIVTDLPTIWSWLAQFATDSSARDSLFDTAWRLVLVLACALVAEGIVRRAVVRKPLAALARHMPSRLGERFSQPTAAKSEAAATDFGRELRRVHPGAAYAWKLILRLPYVLARLALDLLPVLGFAAVGNLLLAVGIGREPTPRVVILALVNAYVLCRGVLCVTAALVSPSNAQPSLLIIRDETAAYIGIWIRRIVVVAVLGVAVANVALVLGLYRPAYDGLVRLVMLVVHLFVVIIILQCRRNVADFIRAPADARGTLAVMRNRLADVWHVPAIFFNLALWAVWALQVQNGYALLLQYFFATIAVLVIARLALFAILKLLDRVLRISPDFIRQFPGLEARANRYVPMLRGAVVGVVGAVTVIAMLEVWGIDAADWFASGHVGGRLISAFLTIAVAALVALVIWEASNAGLDRHLARLIRENRFARAARLRTFLPMLRSCLLAVIVNVVALTALSELGINIAPLLAGAGIVGIAIGFGSQKLVQDVITGLFLLLENAMQVGDTVTVSGMSGVVENLSIRTIRLRAGDGSIHIIPFSSVSSVTNTNRGIGNAAISVNVAYKEDTDRVGEVLKEIAAQMRADPQFRRMIRGDLDLWGVDKVEASMVTLAGQIECTDAGRWPVQREFYRRMKKRFQELGIEIARSSPTTVVLQGLALQPPGPPSSADATDQSRPRSQQPSP